MNFLYKEVSRKKLTDGWLEGFENNLSSGQMNKLKARLNTFNAMFADAYKGDVLAFDFLGSGDTVVVINGMERGRIAGEDFQRALLAVWLGKHPADKSLKKIMLSQ